MELIREAIYNEFDLHDQGTLLSSKSYIPLDSDTGAIISGVARGSDGNVDHKSK